MRIEINREKEAVAKKIIYGDGDTSWHEDLNGNCYTDTNAFVLTRKEHEEIELAHGKIIELLHKTQEILHTDTALNEWLGLPENLYSLANLKTIEGLTTYGRFDWIFGTNGELNLLEFNSETPMGWKEAIVYTRKAYGYFTQFQNYNTKLQSNLEESIRKTLMTYGDKGFGRIAIVGDLEDAEENDTFSFLKDIVKNVNKEVILCSVSDLRFLTGYDDVEEGVYVEKEGLLYPIDVLQNFYSTEWMAEDEGGEDLIHFIKTGKVVLMNPISTLQLHSKGIFALIWFLLEETSLLSDFKETIWSYIPYSTYNPKEYEGDRLVYKPLNHREGDGIKIIDKYEAEIEDDIVYQEYIEAKKVSHIRKRKDGKVDLVKMTPTIGTFCVNDKFSGYMTRLSEGICSVYDTTFISTFVEEI